MLGENQNCGVLNNGLYNKDVAERESLLCADNNYNAEEQGGVCSSALLLLCRVVAVLCTGLCDSCIPVKLPFNQLENTLSFPSETFISERKLLQAVLPAGVIILTLFIQAAHIAAA